jgi:hypothetical protein
MRSMGKGGKFRMQGVLGGSKGSESDEKRCYWCSVGEGWHL